MNFIKLLLVAPVIMACQVIGFIYAACELGFLSGCGDFDSSADKLEEKYKPKTKDSV